MKQLQALYDQMGIPLKAQYYMPYLDQEEIVVITQAVHKKSQRYQWNLLRLLALKVITQLKGTAPFYSEPRLKTYFSEIEAALLVNEKDHRALRHALGGADGRIEAAWAMRAARPGILATAQPQSMLSESQDRQYETVRQTYLAHNDTLTAWDAQVNQLKNAFYQIPGLHRATPFPEWKEVPRELPSSLLDYRPGACRIRLSEGNIFNFVREEGRAREVYQGLTAQLTPKPTVEAVAEKMQSAKIFLNYKAESILNNATRLRQSILQETRRAIEHRTQIKLAHAEKIERLLLALENVIQLSESYLAQDQSESKNPAPSLSCLLREAKLMQTALESAPFTLTTASLEQKLLSLDTHRQRFAQSITSGWSVFFSSGRQARRRREQQLNTALQSILARMVTPLYGFNDHAAVITPDQVKQQHALVCQLDEQQVPVTVEHKQVEKIKNTFAR